MNPKLTSYLEDFSGYTPGASERMIAAVQKEVGFEFPADYLEVMREYNGGEGSIHDNSWLFLFSIEKLQLENENYAFVMEQIPDYLLFGKSAGDGGFAFHKKHKTYHEFGLMANVKYDFINHYGNSFTEFLERLATR